MRIRSVHPEFWRSEDVAALDWATRLVFIGLWSYVDDNGVGRDVERLVQAELFPLEEDPRDTLATVSRALQALCDGGQITRYSIDGKPLLHITAWDKWQRIDRPGKVRYAPPTCENAVIRDTLATPSRDVRETPATGEGEKGRRGEGEKTSSSAAADADFAEFWAAYPRKQDKGAARKAFKAATRKESAGTITAALRNQLLWFQTQVKPAGDFRPLASSWLNGERWTDESQDVTTKGALSTKPDALPGETEDQRRLRLRIPEGW